MGRCHELRVHYALVIIQVVHGITQLLVKPMKETSSQVLLDFAHAQCHRIFLLNCIQHPSNELHILASFPSFLVAAFKNFALKYQRMPWCHI